MISNMVYFFVITIRLYNFTRNLQKNLEMQNYTEYTYIYNMNAYVIWENIQNI